MAKPLNIIGGWYSDEAKPWSDQDICNYIPFRAEQGGTLSAIQAIDAPGLKPFVEIDSNGGIRGAINVEGKLLVVAGTGLYQISNTGVAIPRGTIPGTGLVSMGYNQAGIANQVLIGNGSAGYVYDTSALTLERITDPGFPGTKGVDYLDSYLLGVEPLGRFWFHSNLADATDYNKIDRYEAETSPDRIVTLAVSNEEVVVFGQTTTDFFVNTGATTGTFQSKGVSMNVGCASANSVVKLDNTLFWLDNFGIPQRLNGYAPVPCTTRVLEKLIGSTNPDGSPKFDWSRCVATTYQDKGRKIVYWTFREGLTIGYDVTTGLCHRREAYGLNGRDRISCIVNWNRKWIAGDYVSGRLYELDWDYMLQVDQPHVRKLKTAPLASDAGHRVQADMVRLIFDTGGPETIAIPFPVQPESPSITPVLTDGTVMESWAGGTYVATGGTPPYTYTSRTGTVWPGNLGPMSATGVVPVATPDTAGDGVNVVRVTDANGLYAEVNDEFSISSGPLVFAASIDSPSATILGSKLGDTFDYPIATGLGGNISRIHAAGGRIFVFDGVTAGRVSADNGRTWQSITGIADAGQVNDIAYAEVDGDGDGDGVWIMVYQGGTVSNVISRSTDGVAFGGITVPSRSRFTVAGHESTFVVGGTNRSVEYSTNAGVGFTDATLPLDNPSGGSFGVRSIVHNGTQFIASTIRDDGIAYSANGTSGWTFVPHPFGAGVAQLMLGAHDGRSFATTLTLTAYSDNPAVSWTAGGTTATSTLQPKLAHNANGAYLGAGSGSGAMVFRTNTGVTWNDSTNIDLKVYVVAMDVLP